MEAAFETLGAPGHFFEGPRWRDGRWWVSDFYRHQVLAITPDGTEEVIATVEHQPSGLGWLPDGSLLIVSMKDHRLLRQMLPGGPLETHAELAGFAGARLNDMVVDRDGHAYVGNFGFDLMTGGQPGPTVLVRVDPDGTAAAVADDLWFPNGSVVTPDGTTLIVGETMACRYTAFTIEADGALSDRRVWAQLGPAPELGDLGSTIAQLTVGPDGCALDAESHIWSADSIGARCIRIAPGGEIVDEIKPPEGLGVFACMLGGDDGRTLLICAAPDFFEHARVPVREAALLTTTVSTPHAGLP